MVSWRVHTKEDFSFSYQWIRNIFFPAGLIWLNIFLPVVSFPYIFWWNQLISEYRRDEDQEDLKIEDCILTTTIDKLSTPMPNPFLVLHFPEWKSFDLPPSSFAFSSSWCNPPLAALGLEPTSVNEIFTIYCRKHYKNLSTSKWM